jgi:hypothetical protein
MTITEIPNDVATAERKSTKQTLLERLQVKQVELTAEVEEARARVAEYPALLQEAREKSWYASPQRRPGTELNGEVRKLTDREQKDLAKMRSLEQDLSALNAVVNEEATREAERSLIEVRKRDNQERTRQRELIKQAGEQFAELFDTYDDLLAAAEDHARIRDEARRTLPANLLAYLDSEGPALLLSPMPTTFQAFTRMLHEAATNPELRSEPYVEPLIDAGVFSTESGARVYDVRTAGTRLVDTRKRLDDRSILIELVPDLRSSVRRVQLGGRIPTITE